jgi:tRNA(Ile)-lysidine synthase TilS/MesJ
MVDHGDAVAHMTISFSYAYLNGLDRLMLSSLCVVVTAVHLLRRVCGVFRRQALDRGAAQLQVDHIVTGHNADDIAETVLMNSTC